MAATFSISLSPRRDGCSMKWAATRCGKRRGSRRCADRFGDSEAGMIATRDSFYLATVSQSGWPHISIAAACRGFCICWMTPPPRWPISCNRQYITTGTRAAATGPACF